MTTETEESPGVTSSMRVLVRDGKRLAVFMALAGVALAAAMLVFDRGYELVPIAAILVGGSAVTPSGLGYAKARQAEAEIRTVIRDKPRPGEEI